MPNEKLQQFQEYRLQRYSDYLADGLDPSDAWSTATRDAAELL